MASITSLIDTIATPPLVSLQQVLDTSGPFASGDHVIDNFTTGGAFLLPAGTYAVAGTYGVVIRATVIPAAAGRRVGFNGIVGGQDVSADEYFDIFAQLVLLKSFPISGAIYPIQVESIQRATQLVLWNGWTAAPNHIGLHVFPGWTVDLYWMCVL